MALLIKDKETAELIAKLASLRGLSGQNAVKLAVRAELACIAEAIPLRDRFAAFIHPLPSATGLNADKAFSTICRAGPEDAIRPA